MTLPRPRLGAMLRRVRTSRRVLILLGFGLTMFLIALIARLPATWTVHEVERRFGVAIACGAIHGTLLAGSCDDAALAINGMRRLRATRLDWRFRLGAPPRFDVDLAALRLDGIPADPAIGDYRLAIETRLDGRLQGNLQSISADAAIELLSRFTLDRANRTLHLTGSAQPRPEAPAELRQALTLFSTGPQAPGAIDLRLNL